MSSFDGLWYHGLGTFVYNWLLFGLVSLEVLLFGLVSLEVLLFGLVSLEVLLFGLVSLGILWQDTPGVNISGTPL